jgi:signal transduction histidine kinase
VKELGALLDENQDLRRRLQAAAAREAEINEQFLHRIGRDLHDGPAQDLALALLHLDEACRVNPPQLETIRHALQSALNEIRTLAAGLQLPELESLSTTDVVRRAVREFQRKTGAAVELEPDLALPPLSLSKKIAIYRVIAEALYNSYRHAGAKNLRVQLGASPQSIWAEIVDSGPGFDPATLSADGNHLGIAGLQQRVALLAGSFDIKSHKDGGTRIRVDLPLEEN